MCQHRLILLRITIHASKGQSSIRTSNKGKQCTHRQTNICTYLYTVTSDNNKHMSVTASQNRHVQF